MVDAPCLPRRNIALRGPMAAAFSLGELPIPPFRVVHANEIADSAGSIAAKRRRACSMSASSLTVIVSLFFLYFFFFLFFPWIPELTFHYRSRGVIVRVLDIVRGNRLPISICHQLSFRGIIILAVVIASLKIRRIRLVDRHSIHLRQMPMIQDRSGNFSDPSRAFYYL